MSVTPPSTISRPGLASDATHPQAPRMRRRGVLLIALAVAFAAGTPPSAGEPTVPPTSSSVAVLYGAPLREALTVVHPFDAPASPYAAGERGVDLAAGPGVVVLAAGSGVVTFAGAVAERGVVVIAHADGISTEYEPVAPSVATGERISVGSVIGVVSGTHSGCAPGACLHWGARRGQLYLDPMSLLGGLGVVRLLPWH
jgi:murein DD-endopeptidase MepM/ murein hydrolase activator NlpD